MCFSESGMPNLYVKLVLFHKVVIIGETHTFNNTFDKYCIILPTTTFFGHCIVLPTIIVFKYCTVSYSAIFHEALPISEFKIQIVYCNTSQVLLIFN